jgi:hypothetical protein
VVTASTPGYTRYGTRTTCVCMAQWLPAFETLARARGLLDGPLGIAQLTGTAKKSAETHTRGGAADWWQTSTALRDLAREMGAAAWIRGAPAFDPHTHAVLNGCPHNTPARYQVEAYKAGFDGLGKGGRATQESKTRRSLRTWSEGIKWAEAQTPSIEEDDMYTDKDRERDDRTHDRVLKLMGPVEEIHKWVRGVATAMPTVQRWVGYLMPAATKQTEGIAALREQVEQLAATTSDADAQQKLEQIKALLS